MNVDDFLAEFFNCIRGVFSGPEDVQRVQVRAQAGEIELCHHLHHRGGVVNGSADMRF